MPMILASDIKGASFDVRRKAKATRAFERGDHVLVAPHDAEKALRVVSFLPTGYVLCCNATTGEQCEANSFRVVCYHAVAADRRREINAKRRATINGRRREAA